MAKRRVSEEEADARLGPEARLVLTAGVGSFAGNVEREDLARWIGDYERAWRAPGTARLENLFAPAATYLAAPFDSPLHGLAAIASFWEAERHGPNEVFELSWEPVAVEGDTGVARVEVHYGGPPARVYRDVWIVTLAGDGRCIAFEEWPFFPAQPRVSTAAQASRSLNT